MQALKQKGLRGPWVDVPYEPTLYQFLGPFDVYNREHTLGVELNTWDMNDASQRAALIRRDITGQFKELGYRHRHALVAVLAQALQDPGYDFQAILEHDPESTYALPPPGGMTWTTRAPSLSISTAWCGRTGATTWRARRRKIRATGSRLIDAFRQGDSDRPLQPR